MVRFGLSLAWGLIEHPGEVWKKGLTKGQKSK